MSTHQARRFFLIWTPIFLTGIALIATASFLTPTTNGLTILGASIALAGMGAAARDDRNTP